MMKLRINPLVVADLREIREYISRDNMEKATEVIEEFYGKFENLRLFPDMGTSLSRRVRFKTDYKYIVWNDYVIIYKTKDDFVEIYRVINRYQDITQIFE